MDEFNPRELIEMMFDGSLPGRYKDMINGVTATEVNSIFEENEKKDEQ